MSSLLPISNSWKHIRFDKLEQNIVCLFSWRYNPLRLYFYFSLLVVEVF